MKNFNLFKKKKSIVCYDLSEKPKGFTIEEIIELYNKTGIILVDSFKNSCKLDTKEINTHIIRL